MNKTEDTILALASIMQTTALVNDLAYKGECDAQSCDASIASIGNSSNEINEIYTKKDDLGMGLKALKQILVNKSKSKNIIVYALSLINLEKKLMKESKMLDNISKGIMEVKASVYFDINHKNSIEKLANVYTDNIAKLKPTVMVNGKQKYLSNKKVANHIRALLLAGLRSVSLWKQGGGSVWYLFFYKQKIIKQLNSMGV